MAKSLSKADPRVRQAMVAVFVVFGAVGFLFASWASRIPTVQRLLDLSPGQMGLLLLVGSLGSVISLPLSGKLVGQFGAAATVLGAAAFATGGLVLTVTAVANGQVYIAAGGLFVALMGVGAMDVAMNFEGTVVEQKLGRAIMPWFHGCFSLGTIGGAGLGTILSRADISITTHIYIASGVTVAMIGFGVSRFFPKAQGLHAQTAGAGDENTSVKPGGAPSYLGAWLEPRTLFVGLIVLATSLTEGAANDWLALGIREGFHVAEHQGALGLTVFVTAMTIMRFGGTWLLDRYGRVRVLQLSTGLAIAGLAIFALVPWLPLAMVGAVLWGLGAALGFPVGMSAASDEPARAAARLSVVSTIGYTAFLAGPPLLGLLADHVGYRHALLAIGIPLIASLFVMGRVAPPASEPFSDPAPA